MTLLGVLQLSLGQAVRHEERVARLLPQGTSFRDGWIRGRVRGPGVVHFRPYYRSSGGA